MSRACVRYQKKKKVCVKIGWSSDAWGIYRRLRQLTVEIFLSRPLFHIKRTFLPVNISSCEGNRRRSINYTQITSRVTRKLLKIFSSAPELQPKTKSNQLKFQMFRLFLSKFFLFCFRRRAKFTVGKHDGMKCGRVNGVKNRKLNSDDETLFIFYFQLLARIFPARSRFLTRSFSTWLIPIENYSFLKRDELLRLKFMSAHNSFPEFLWLSTNWMCVLSFSVLRVCVWGRRDG